MFAAGVALFTLGYALAWTGVERFRGNKVTLIESLGGKGGTNTDITKSAADNAPAVASGTPTAKPATNTTGRSANAADAPAGTRAA